jgi:4-amino-4-deoxy-L-arabinose transferase-like glycosyltransferase
LNTTPSPLLADSASAKKAPIRRLKNVLITIGVLAVALQAALIFVVIPSFSGRLHSLYNQNGYADGYDELATNLAEGHGYRFYPDTAETLMREPGYPLLLAGIFVAFGKSFTAVKLANMLAAVGAAWMIALLARKVSQSPIVFVASPLLFLFHPATVIAESRGGVEMLFTLLLTSFMLLLYRAMESGRWKHYFISGGLLGLAVLVKSTPMLFPLVLGGYFLSIGQRGATKGVIVRRIAVLCLAMSIVLSPWIIRNYILTKKLVPTASVLGISAHAGQYICSHLSSGRNWVDLDRQAARERKSLAIELGYPFRQAEGAYYQAFYSSGDELRFSSYLLQGVVDEYKREPALFVRCIRSNLFNLWFAAKTVQATKINMVVQVPYLILAAAGILLAAMERGFHKIGPIVLFILYTMGVHAIILAQARYSVPLIPFLSILACLSLARARKYALRRVNA